MPRGPRLRQRYAGPTRVNLVVRRLRSGRVMFWVDREPEGLRHRRGKVNLNVELEREDDGRWIAEVAVLPGVLAYGESREQALARAEALALRVLAERLEHGEQAPESFAVTFLAA